MTISKRSHITFITSNERLRQSFCILKGKNTNQNSRTSLKRLCLKSGIPLESYFYKKAESTIFILKHLNLYQIDKVIKKYLI